MNEYKTVSSHVTLPVYQMKVETTKVCNLKCPGCRRNYATSISSEPGPKHLTPELLWKFIAGTNIQVVRFEGDGEPTCNPYFQELIRMCHKLGIRSAMTSNATLLTPSYVKFLEEHGMSRIHVSFDGACQDTFEKARVGASFEQVKYACQLLGQSKIQLFMNVVLFSDEIIEQLPEYARLAKQLGATGVHLMKFQSESLKFGVGPDLSKHLEPIRAFKEQARRLGLMYVATCTEHPTFVGCDDAYTCPYVLLDGRVVACSYMANLRRSEVYQGKVYPVPYENFIMGTIDEHSLADVWKGSDFTELRRLLQNTKSKVGRAVEPKELHQAREQGYKSRFDYCITCLCRWGESGI
jgi:MoaA/NifB/PqqE/SkfB family radical SAM enzyme